MLRCFLLVLVASLTRAEVCSPLVPFIQTGLPFHSRAAFLSVSQVQGGYIGFYRTAYNSYECGALVLDERLRLVVDLGQKVSRCEDPRSFSIKGEVYVVDNHMGHPRRWVHLTSGKETVARTQHVNGKNWSPIVHDDKLYFVFKFEPLCIITCDVDSGKCKDVTPCDETISQWRGGSNGMVSDGTVFGYGHYTHTGDHHSPFFWQFPIDVLGGSNVPVVAQKTIVPLSPSGIHDPSALVEMGGRLYLGVTESEGSWFHDQSINLTWYGVSPCWLESNNIVVPKLRATHRRAIAILLIETISSGASTEGREFERYTNALHIFMRSLRISGNTDTVVAITSSTTPSAWLEIAKVYRIDVRHVIIIQSPGVSGHYQNMATKFHVWNLIEFDQVAYFDVDRIFMRDPSDVFSLCTADFCAVHDHGVANSRYFNAGFFVTRPSRETFANLFRVSASGAYSGQNEQDLFNHIFNNWLALPDDFNLMPKGFVSRAADAIRGSVSVHEKYWHLNEGGYDNLPALNGQEWPWNYLLNSTYG